MHRCGSVGEAKTTAAAGADAAIAQTVEPSGHVRATTPTLKLHDQVRTAGRSRSPSPAQSSTPQACETRSTPVRLAPSRHARPAQRESHAHPEYKRRCLQARETVLTQLFGLGWPDAPHRVIPWTCSGIDWRTLARSRWWST